VEKVASRLLSREKRVGKEEKSMAEGNEALAHRFHMDIFQEGNLDAADEILSPDFVWHGAFSPGEDQRGPQPTKQVASQVISAFPDRRISHEETIAQGDKVLIRWSMSGTQEGEIQGIPATGRGVTLTGLDLFRIEGGKIAEMWQEADRLGMMQQLGVIPEPGQQSGGSLSSGQEPAP
jgi:steroid delta-isomerase-like uncharacterized protein